MKTGKIFPLIVGLVGLLALAAPALAAHKRSHSSSGGSAQTYTLDFIPTENALSPETSARMTIKVVNGETIVHFRLRNGHPNMVYTIWIVYNKLTWPLPNSEGSVPSCSISPIRPSNGAWCPDSNFPPEGLGVAPPTRLDKPTTDGMGLDPGPTFVSDQNGNGEAQVKLDFNLVGLGIKGDKPDDGPPVGNKNLITQCLPGLPNANGCPAGSGKILIAGTWLRKFIIDVKPEDRVLSCANYDPASDPTNVVGVVYGPVVPGVDARYWQCIDPATLRDPNDPWSGLPRVPRFPFDHFRLAPHPDALTHGFFGGNFFDHFIEAVGLRCDRSNGVVGRGLTPQPADCPPVP